MPQPRHNSNYSTLFKVSNWSNFKLISWQGWNKVALITRDRNFILAKPKSYYVVWYLFASASSRQRPTIFYKILPDNTFTNLDGDQVVFTTVLY